MSGEDQERIDEADRGHPSSIPSPRDRVRAALRRALVSGAVVGGVAACASCIVMDPMPPPDAGSQCEGYCPDTGHLDGGEDAGVDGGLPDGGEPDAGP